MKIQRDRVIIKLRRDGYVSRNEALRNYISRLGAIICDLKKDGWDFETKREKGDYVYKVIRSPEKKITYTIGSINKVITVYK